MYDDLARTQNLPPLERFVVHAVIPSLVVTLVLQLAASRRMPALSILATPLPQVEYVLFADQPVEVTSVPENELPFAEPYRCVESALLDDDTPVILRWTRAGDAAHLLHADVEGCVVLEAIVDTTGRARPHSISVVSATNPGFIAPARRALLATLFRPAMVGGTAVRMRVRIPYEFAIRNAPGRGR